MNYLNYNELKQKSINNIPFNLVNELGFIESLNMARHMLLNEKWDEALQEYAVKMLEEIRENYPNEWNNSWKYDAFLGFSYDIIFKYDEKYASFKRAFNKISPQPPELLVALAGCCWTPGKPPISEEESIELVKQAIQTTPYIEAVELLRGLYKSLGNLNEQLYWEDVLEKVKDNGLHLPSLEKILNE